MLRLINAWTEFKATQEYNNVVNRSEEEKEERRRLKKRASAIWRDLGRGADVHQRAQQGEWLEGYEAKLLRRYRSGALESEKNNIVSKLHRTSPGKFVGVSSRTECAP